MTADLLPHERRLLATTITPERFREDVARYSGLHSRHADHPQNRQAVDMLVGDFGTAGGSPLAVDRLDFCYADPVVLHNVQARLPERGLQKIVIVSAHLDSTANLDPGYQPRLDSAPGADDDASGIAGVLAAARAIAALDQAHTGPRREIRFVLFNAEEAGRIGSQDYVASRVDPCAVAGVYHLDMIGYDSTVRRRFEVHAGYAEDSTTASRSRAIAEVLADLVPQIAPELTVQRIYEKTDPAQGFSDHTSFHHEYAPACLVSEDFFMEGGGPGRDPNRDYHLREDTADHVDAEYGAAIARVVAAAAWHLAVR